MGEPPALLTERMNSCVRWGGTYLFLSVCGCGKARILAPLEGASAPAGAEARRWRPPKTPQGTRCAHMRARTWLHACTWLHARRRDGQSQDHAPSAGLRAGLRPQAPRSAPRPTRRQREPAWRRSPIGTAGGGGCALRACEWGALHAPVRPAAGTRARAGTGVRACKRTEANSTLPGCIAC